MIDAGIEEYVAENALVKVAEPHVLSHAAEPSPVIGHGAAAMRDDEFDLRKIGEHVRHHEMHESGGVRPEIVGTRRVHRRMTGAADMDHRRHVELAHRLVERIPVAVAKRPVLPVAARRVRVQVAADEAHLFDAAPKFGDAAFDRCLGALRQLTDRHEILRKHVADTPDEIVAMFGPGLRCRGVADMMPHPAGTRREDGHVGAPFLLDLQLVAGDAFPDLVIGHRHRCLFADVIGVGGDSFLLRVAPGADAGRRGCVVTVAVDDHDRGSG